MNPLAPRYAGSDLTELSAVEQARRIVDGTLTSSALVDVYLARIQAHDGELSAFARVLERSARRQAESADRLRARGAPLGPFHGVPTAVKDHHLVRWTSTRLGSRGFPPLLLPFEDGTVRGLRRAGFVILGKTTMSEIGLLPIVETELHPPTRNPWDRSRTAGGSSGGAGAAVAAGLVPIAPGSDGAGSVRIPAALNGLLGHKPTRGLVPMDADRIDTFRLSVIGPLARCVDDAAALLDVLSSSPDGRHAVGSRAPLRPLRIGVVREPPFGEIDARLVAAVDRAATRLRDAGHQLEDRPCPPGTLDDFVPLYQRFMANIPVPFPGRMHPTARWFREAGKAVTPEDARRRFEAFTTTGAEAMRGLDVLLTPSVGMIAPLVGQFAHLPPRELFAAVAPLGAFTALANITGQPGISVPLGDIDGLPVGVQMLAHAGEDSTLLALARLFETD